jgi:hypothetical protein
MEEEEIYVRANFAKEDPKSTVPHRAGEKLLKPQSKISELFHEVIQQR